MPNDIKSKNSTRKSSRAPAMSIEANDNEMISLANKCAREQLRNGTASSQIICHYLKMGSERERLAVEQAKADLELTRAKTKSIESSERMESMFARALSAFSDYRGETDSEGDDDDEEDIL